MKAQITYKEFIEAKSFGFTNPLNTFEVSCSFWISENYIEDKSPVPMFAAGERPRAGQWVKVEDNSEFDFSLLLDLDVRVFAKYKKYVVLKGEPDISPIDEPSTPATTYELMGAGVTDLATLLSAGLEDNSEYMEPEPELESKVETIEDMFLKMFEDDMKIYNLPEGYPVGATHYNSFDGLLIMTSEVTKRWSPAGQNWEDIEIPRHRATFSIDIYLDHSKRMYIQNRDKYQDYNMETNSFEQRMHAPQFYETLYPADPQLAIREQGL